MQATLARTWTEWPDRPSGLSAAHPTRVSLRTHARGGPRGKRKKNGKRQGRLHLTPSHLGCTLFLRSLALRVLLVYNLIPRHHLSPLHTLLVPRPPQTSLPGVLTHTLLPTSKFPRSFLINQGHPQGHPTHSSRPTPCSCPQTAWTQGRNPLLPAPSTPQNNSTSAAAVTAVNSSARVVLEVLRGQKTMAALFNIIIFLEPSRVFGT